MRGPARRVAVENLARSYFKLLTWIDWKDPVLVGGLGEGLNKFLSNAHLAAFPGSKYHKTHFVSESALLRLRNPPCRELVCEHPVPKARYIQDPCEQLARDGKLTLEFVRDQLLAFWYLATITKAEDALLPKEMPPDWDGKNVLARYEAAGLRVIPNPYFSLSTV